MLHFVTVIALLLTTGVLAVQPANTRFQSQLSLLVIQQFEHGVMVSNADLPQAVEVISSDGTLFQFGPINTQNLPDNPISELAPNGFVKPDGLFGKIWGNIPEIRQRLGWAIQLEQQATASVENAAGQHGYFLTDGHRLIESGIGAIYPPTVKLQLLNGNAIESYIGSGSFTTSDISPVIKPWTRRIQFAAGAVSGSAIGLLDRISNPSFVLWARAGQRMTISIASFDSANISISVTIPAGTRTSTSAQSSGVIFDGILPQSGDYIVSITTDSRGELPYELTFKVI